MPREKFLHEIVYNYFDGGFNCAESVLLSGAEILGIKESAIPRIATAFGGGLSGNGYTCGAISGGLMVISLYKGRREASDLESKRMAYELASQLLGAFTGQFGSLECKKLTGIDFKTEEGVKQYKNHVHMEVCVPMVEFVIRWINDNL